MASSFNNKDSTNPSRESKPLPLGYTPNPFDVICGRGNECMHHIGNKYFRQLLNNNLMRYTNVEMKSEKSIIIIDMIRIIQNESGGKFIKKDLLTGKYQEVGDVIAVSIFVNIL